MTKLLEQAIAKVRELPDADQDEAAEVLRSVVSKFRGPVHLDDETRAAIREGSEQANRSEFVGDDEMNSEQPDGPAVRTPPLHTGR